MALRRGTCDPRGARGGCRPGGAPRRRTPQGLLGPPTVSLPAAAGHQVATNLRGRARAQVPRPPPHRTPSPTEGTWDVSVSPKQDCSGHLTAAGPGSCRGGGGAEAPAGTRSSGGRGVPSGDPQGGARRGSEVKIQEAAHGGDAWGISLRRDPFPGKRMRTAFLRVDYEGGWWVGAPRRMSSRTGRRRGCRGRRKTRGFQTGAGSRARVGRGVQDGQRGGHRGQARPARCCRGCGAPAPLPGAGSPLVPCPSLLSGPSRLPAFHLPSDKTRA